MSAYSEQTTEFKDAELLVTALTAMGLTNIESYAEAVPLTNYYGETRITYANVLVKRLNLKHAYDDLGFVKTDNGTYRAITSDYDRNEKTYASGAGFDANWFKRLKVEYAKAGIMRQAKRAGLKVAGQKRVNGKLQLQFVKL